MNTELLSGTESDKPIAYIAIALVAGAALAYEVALTRLLAIVHWHHFAGMVISLALLGYGASGTALYLLRRTVLRRARLSFTISALAFAIAAPLCFQFVQALALNPSELPWDARLWWRLGAIYLLLALPFFAAASCIGIALMASGTAVNRVYAADLLGAGIGALAVVLLMTMLAPQQLLPAISLVALLGMAVAGWQLRQRGSFAFAAFAVALILALAPAGWNEIRPAPYKDLSRARAVIGAQVIEQRASPLGQLTLLANTQVPFRFAPGLSFRATSQPPPQHALFVDGAGAAAVPRQPVQAADTAYLGELLSALPYRLFERPRTLLIGLGGGSDIRQALALDARAVTVAERDEERIALVFRHARAAVVDPRVRLLHGDARTLLAGTREVFDLIKIDRLQGGIAGGLAAHSADYLLTAEAIDTYLDRLAPDGILAVNLWLELPPRSVFKLAATAIRVLRQRGVAQPAGRLAVIRGWKTVTVLVGNEAFGAERIETIRAFCQSLDFDPVYFDSIRPDELNRHNRLETPLVHAGLAALAGPDAGAFRTTYPFDIEPATDDRPYFDDFSRWRTLPDLLDMPARGGFAQIEWGYWIQLATLLQTMLLGAVLILAPLLAARHAAPVDTGRPKYTPRMLIYFLLLGLAFIAVEIAFIQQLQLILGHPVYAVAVTLAAFLVAAGCGSAASRRWLGSGRRPLRWLALGITVIAFAELWLFDSYTASILGLPAPVRLAIVLAMIAPLGFCMGMPFPWGLRRLMREAPALVPWAWGVNGFASVVSAILAGLLAIEVGFSGVLGIAALLYPVASLLPGATRVDANDATVPATM